MGNYDSKGADNARLDTNIHSWADVEAQLGPNIDAVAATSHVDIRGMLRSVASHCFQQADVWKNQQIRSSDSDYSKKKSALLATQTKMISDMDTGLTSMNKSYKDVMSVLGGRAVALDRSQCTKSDPDKMEACFSAVKTQVQNLLEGTGISATTKSITGSPPNTPGFQVSCNGLNGCVTAFKNVRDNGKKYTSQVQQLQQTYVQQGNQQTQQQLTALAGQLSGMQSQISAQYDVMKATMLKMGIAAPDALKTMDPEALQANPGPPPGPYQNPKNMSSVLSGMMQPGGMINFSDTGMADLQKQLVDKAAEKKAAAADDLKRYLTMQTNYNNFAGTCQIGAAGTARTPAPASVTNSSTDNCATCAQQVDQCNSALPATASQDAINLTQISSLLSKMNGSSSVDSTSLKQSISALSPGLNCGDLVSYCNLCASQSKSNGTGQDLNNQGTSGTAGSANGNTVPSH